MIPRPAEPALRLRASPRSSRTCEALPDAAFCADFEEYRAEAAPPFVLHELRGIAPDPAQAPRQRPDRRGARRT